MPPENITASVVQRIESVLREVQGFEFSLAKVARFPATAYLEPEPASPFIALTESLTREFPQFPPFGGEFPNIVPHLTVAHGSVTEAGATESELVSSLALHGPITSICSSLVLMENSSGTWRQMHVFPLARSQTAG
jgi:2'-5' RNA ligase